MHRTLGSMLRKLVERKIDWAMQVKFTLFALRSTPCRMTGYSPFELVYGRELLTPLSLVADELRQPKRHSHKVEEWLEELRRRQQAVREVAEKNQKKMKEAMLDHANRKARARELVKELWYG